MCHESDPKLISCLIESIEFLKPYLRTGVPELDMPSVEPLHISDLVVSESSASNGLHITTKDIDVYGASDFSLSNLK